MAASTNTEISAHFESLLSLIEEYESTSNDNLANRICEVGKLLTTEFSASSSRETISEQQLMILARILRNDSLRTYNVNTVTEIFRMLRNLCAGCRRNQDLIIKQEILLNESLNVLLQLIENSEYPTTERTLCVRCAIQFWGNVIVNNDDNKRHVWSLIKQHFSKLLDESMDKTALNYSFMVLCNCLRDEPDNIQTLMSDFDVFSSIFFRLVGITVKHDLEWGVILLQYMVIVDGFLEKLNAIITDDSWLFVLEATLQSLHLDRERHISGSNIVFLAQQFKKKSSFILSLESATNTEKESAILLKTLEILCTISAMDEFRTILQDDLDLLSTVTWLVKSIHLVGKTEGNNFTPVVKLSSVAYPEKMDSNPANGLKRDLIRMIANLSYKSAKNQNHFRELDGIPVLLDCCNLDARNPFLIQWVILAIRNLCEDNQANQNVISAMESLGKVDFAFASEINSLHSRNSTNCSDPSNLSNTSNLATPPEISIGSGSSTATIPANLINPSTSSIITPMERSREDIENLFS